MEIVRVKSVNIKGVSFIEILPSHGTTIIGGKNGNGKSSFLDSIAMALGGKALCPPVPIRKGQTEGFVEVEVTGDQERMVQPCTITRKFWFDKNGELATTLTIKTKQGFTAPSPQAVLDAVVGKLGFDPERFLRMDAKQQASALRTLVGIDFTKLDDQYKKLYAERTQVNKDGTAKKAVYESMNGYPEAPAEEVSVASLMDELKAREEHNLKNAKARDHATSLAKTTERLIDAEKDAGMEVTRLQQALTEALDKFKLCTAAIKEHAATVEAAREAAALLVDQDIAGMHSQIAGSQEVNRQVRANADRAKAEKELQALREKSAALTKQLKAIDEDKEKQLGAAKWPVPGLGFTDEGMTFNGLPFEQASAKEKRQAAFGINCAGSPALRFAFIQDGSLLDDDALKEFATIAAEHKMQLFVERVGSGAECQIVIENGAVVRAEEGFLPKGEGDASQHQKGSEVNQAAGSGKESDSQRPGSGSGTGEPG